MGMAQKATNDALAQFEAIDGIEVNKSGSSHDGLVKVMDENAVGAFFKLKRTTDATISSVTRNCLHDTAVDAWIDL
jgi:hypothetical protein